MDKMNTLMLLSVKINNTYTYSCKGYSTGISLLQELQVDSNAWSCNVDVKWEFVSTMWKNTLAQQELCYSAKLDQKPDWPCNASQANAALHIVNTRQRWTWHDCVPRAAHHEVHSMPTPSFFIRSTTNLCLYNNTTLELLKVCPEPNWNC